MLHIEVYLIIICEYWCMYIDPYYLHICIIFTNIFNAYNSDLSYNLKLFF